MKDYSALAIASTVSVDSLPYDYIAGIDQKFESKLFNPQSDDSATERLVKLRQTWRKAGATTVFASGVYDMLHMDHAGYLLHTKAVGAASHYNRTHHEQDWDELESDQQQNYTTLALGNRSVRLIVSVDGNDSVDKRKGHSVEKGGTARPIYSWNTRALMVARLAFVDPSDEMGERLLPTVDAVTIHGPDDFTADSLHASHFDLVGKIQPDVWAIFGESQDILDAAPVMPSLSSVELRCIQDGKGTHYFEDDFMGKMSTTNIVKRILG